MRIYGNHTENPCRYTTKRDRHETIDEADNDLGFRSFGYILYLKKTNKTKKNTLRSTSGTKRYRKRRYLFLHEHNGPRRVRTPLA